jgi:hypothetical protein
MHTLSDSACIPGTNQIDCIHIYICVCTYVCVCVIYRYIFQGDGGDQVTGRLLSGLPYHGKEFATLPPHFDVNTLAHWTDTHWTAILPSYSSMPACFKQTLPYLLASVLYHEDWLFKTLPAQHPLRTSVLYTNPALYQQVQQLRSQVLVGESHCPITHLMATGIPVHLCIVNQLVDVSNNLMKQGCEMKQLLEQLPHLVTQSVLSKCSVNGAIPLTKDDLTSLCNTIISQLKPHSISTTSTQHNVSSFSNTSGSAHIEWKLWTWGGKLHMVPQGWTLPSTHIKEIWSMWFTGNAKELIGPLWRLRPGDMANSNQAMQLTRTKHVMDKLEQLSIPFQNGIALSSLPYNELMLAFDQAYNELHRLLGRQVYRVGDTAIGTLYNAMLKKWPARNNKTN